MGWIELDRAGFVDELESRSWNDATWAVFDDTNVAASISPTEAQIRQFGRVGARKESGKRRVNLHVKSG